ncbi:MAG: CheR family methyltransferase [Pseudomonadota bacterium]
MALMDPTGFNEIADLALRKSGHNFRPTQRYVIEARLGDIIRREGFANLDGLAHCLKARPNKELERDVVAALPSKQSRFFRDRPLFKRLINTVLPGIAATSDKKRLRVLCAGGGAGQEAYSLAMLQNQREAETSQITPVEFVSVDICRHATRRGREGRFSHFEVQTGLSIHHLLENFERFEDGSWQVVPELRETISFRAHNLMDDLTGLGEFDVILCCNVLQTMAPGVARGLGERLGAQLAPEGVLFLGEGEAIQMDDHYSLQVSRDIRGGYEFSSDKGDLSSLAS